VSGGGLFLELRIDVLPHQIKRVRDKGHMEGDEGSKYE
jgi:hypothetical protein